MEPLLRDWCERYLGAAPAGELFRRGHLSTVVGVRLSDGRQVVLKVRPPDDRIAGCIAVQRRLYERGFPCPEPIAGPWPLGGATATAEALVPGGLALERSGDAHRQLAALLVRLVRLAPSASEVPSLDPAPPWVGWANGGSGTWPRPDDLDANLDDHPGPAWIDETARWVRERLARLAAPAVVGHLDWESHNIRWLGAEPYVVDDWDSVAALPEATIAGAAAAVYPATADGRVVAASTSQTDAFLRSYELARGARWEPDEEQAGWAAGLWVMAFNAKKETVGRRTGLRTLGGSTGYADHLRREVEERLRRAGG